MNVYTFSEARQKLAHLLERANKEGEVQIKRRDGKKFIITPLKVTKSPLDVKGINLKVTTKDIVAIVRKMRERD
ncbi:MAG: type II toxin-antitoxin system Phd/YefM family antitoxin [Planctomycetes bacterium]|nr:type II toxin-antitoxin system Phd/YefM family antitoxin [Planctomycetota bacterium]